MCTKNKKEKNTSSTTAETKRVTTDRIRVRKTAMVRSVVSYLSILGPRSETKNIITLLIITRMESSFISF